jgi:energy-coupling factor transport system ATP-binding protein
MLNGLLKPTSGEVIVDGMNTADEETEIEVKRRVGMVFQNPDNQLVASIVEEDVAFGPENLGLEPSVIRERVDDALKSVGMYEFRKSTPHHLSGGQKQRIAIAGIIAMQPECIILDEPTAMLDPVGRAEIIETLHNLNTQKNITVVLITHYMEEAENADRVMVMNDGVIIDDNTPKEIFKNVSQLKSVGLSVPQTTELLYSLNQNGFNISTDVLSIKETAKAIALCLEEK